MNSSDSRGYVIDFRVILTISYEWPKKFGKDSLLVKILRSPQKGSFYGNNCNVGNSFSVAFGLFCLDQSKYFKIFSKMMINLHKNPFPFDSFLLQRY